MGVDIRTKEGLREIIIHFSYSGWKGYVYCIIVGRTQIAWPLNFELGCWDHEV
jgi:hypothetical protein